MNFKLEAYDPKKHDRDVLASLIYDSDREMNSLTYGKCTVEVIRKLLDMPHSYFTPEYTRCAVRDDSLAGVVVYYPVSKMKEVDKIAGEGFAKAMGGFSFLKRMPLYLKMSKMLGGDLDDDGMYIHTICVESGSRGKGIGTEILNELEKENPKMYLYVNDKNEKAIRFYEKNGFRKNYHGKMKYRGEELGEFLMERQ